MVPSEGLSHLRPEGRLLVLCARTVINEFIRVEVTDLVGEPLDWDLVWHLAKTNGVVPLVYQNLVKICPSVIPSGTHEALRRHIQANALLNTLLAKELVTVLEALAAKGIRAIPFKGVTLAQTAYGDFSLRECADLDLIVDQSSIPLARQVLWSQGYQLTSKDERSQCESDEPYNFFQKKNGIVAVDLQWVMARQHFAFRLDRGVFWTRLKPVHLPGKSILGLCPEDLLILLCVHGSKHGWEQLKWVCDVAELIHRRKTLDWSRVLFQAGEWGCRRMVLLGLAVAANLFDIRVPKAVLQEIQSDPDIPTCVRHMPKELLKNPQEGIEEERAEALYFTLKDSWREKWKFGVSLCRAESPVITEPLPWFRLQSRLHMLYRCVKPLHRLALRCLPSMHVRKAVVRWLHSSD
ncbi:MAG: nucleotidyltransferase family protein [Nitrospira defluvii]|nr:nucleotidyltransferase family protein [Nitrospira defluvii]